MPTARLFIAVPIRSCPALRTVARHLATLSPALRVTPLENLHLTLSFLGATDVAKVTALLAAMTRATAGMAPFTAEMVGLGAFPEARRPRTIWAGFSPPQVFDELVARLQASLDAAQLAPPPEGRPWSAHLTLARAAGPRRGRAVPPPPDALRRLIKDYERVPLGPVWVDAIHLIESKAPCGNQGAGASGGAGGGAQYISLGSARLAAGG